MRSLRARLVVGTTLAVALVLAGAGWSLHALMERSLIGEVDRALAEKAQLLASTIEQEYGEIDVEFEDLDMTEFSSPEHGGYLELSPLGGTDALYESESLVGHDLQLAPAGVGEDARFWVDLPGGVRGRGARYAFEPRLEEAGPGEVPAQLELVIARDVTSVNEALATLSGLLALVGLLTLATTAAALMVVVRRSLRPAQTVAARIAGISEDDLSVRLPLAEVPQELVPIVERVNGLLARLEGAFKRERSFSSDVAHELRTPLAGLRTTLEVSVAGGAQVDEAVSESLAIVVDLEAMVGRLLDLARLDAGGTATQAESCDVAELAVEAFEPFVRSAAARNLDIQWRLADVPRVRLDTVLTVLVLRNLYENAVTYADAGGSVAVEVRRQSGKLAVVVSNSGSALTNAEARAATQRFWRGDQARSDAARRSGLGLAIAARATEVLGATLDLQSEPGGEFVATLGLRAMDAVGDRVSSAA